MINPIDTVHGTFFDVIGFPLIPRRACHHDSYSQHHRSALRHGDRFSQGHVGVLGKANVTAVPKGEAHQRPLAVGALKIVARGERKGGQEGRGPPEPRPSSLPLPQPYARPTAILGDELHAPSF